MAKKLAAEFLGTAMLLFVVVATGIMVSTIAGDEITETVTSVGAALQLFIVGVSVAVGLAVIIILFVTISGSHFNPIVTMTAMMDRSMDVGTGLAYIVAQFLGAAFGVIIGNLVFGLDPVTISDTIRTGPVLRFSEMVATFLLIIVILGLVRTGRASAVPWAVGGIVLVIVLATSSTGFANPALTAARTLTDTYTGIDPSSVMPFITAQIAGGLEGCWHSWSLHGCSRWTRPSQPDQIRGANSSRPEGWRGGPCGCGVFGFRFTGGTGRNLSPASCGGDVEVRDRGGAWIRTHGCHYRSGSSDMSGVWVLNV